MLTIQAGHGADSNVEWDGLRPRLARLALPRAAGRRARRDADDASLPHLPRRRDGRARCATTACAGRGAAAVGMTRVASGVPCYQAALASRDVRLLAGDARRHAGRRPLVPLHRHRRRRDGLLRRRHRGPRRRLGATTSTPRDWSYALTVYDPRSRRRPGRRTRSSTRSSPTASATATRRTTRRRAIVQYDQTAVKLAVERPARGLLPRLLHALPAALALRRLQPGDREGPQGRDYYGGDLKGVRQSLEQLRAARLQHDLPQPDLLVEVEPRLRHGRLQDDQPVLRHAEGLRPPRAAGARAAACTSSSTASSTTCRRTRRSSTATTTRRRSARASRPRPRTAAGSCSRTRTSPCTSGDYSGWFNFDSIPVLAKSNPAVFDYFVGAQDSVTRTWLNRGADGWRLDVMGDSSFPADYWKRFRQVVKATDPNALIVGELWPKDSTTLSFLAGQRADSTMNYRDRDAILGFLTTHTFDGKGLGDSGRVLAPSEFLSRLDLPAGGLRRACVRRPDEPDRLARHRPAHCGRCRREPRTTRPRRPPAAPTASAACGSPRWCSTRCRACPPCTTATRWASPAETIPTTGARTRGRRRAASLTWRSQRTTARSACSARRRRCCVTARSSRC